MNLLEKINKKLNKKQKAIIIIFMLIVGILSWAFISAGVITHNFNREQVKGNGNKQELAVKSIILTETKEKTKYWEIYGETGSYGSDTKIAMLDNVLGNFYKDNKVAMSFESSKGTYNEEKGQIILYNDTHIVLHDLTELKADRLIWSGSDQDIIAEGNVKIIKDKKFIAEANKAIISPDYESFKIIGNTNTKIFEDK